MCNLTTMKRRELEKRLGRLGWRFRRHGSRHDVWGRGEAELVVPRHAEINEYTARAILCEARGG
jgi:mRNA interferase HicA